jgi:hypothetical protein
LLTGGEAHDFPLAKRLIRRVNPPEHLLGDMAYDGDELREELERPRNKSVMPNRPNRRQPFSFSKRLYKLRWRIESAFKQVEGLLPYRNSLQTEDFDDRTVVVGLQEFLEGSAAVDVTAARRL